MESLRVSADMPAVVEATIKNVFEDDEETDLPSSEGATSGSDDTFSETFRTSRTASGKYQRRLVNWNDLVDADQDELGSQELRFRPLPAVGKIRPDEEGASRRPKRKIQLAKSAAPFIPTGASSSPTPATPSTDASSGFRSSPLTYTTPSQYSTVSFAGLSTGPSADFTGFCYSPQVPQQTARSVVTISDIMGQDQVCTSAPSSPAPMAHADFTPAQTCTVNFATSMQVPAYPCAEQCLLDPTPAWHEHAVTPWSPPLWESSVYATEEIVGGNGPTCSWLPEVEIPLYNGN